MISKRSLPSYVVLSFSDSVDFSSTNREEVKFEGS